MDSWRQTTWWSKALFWQCILAFNVETAADNRRSSVRLTAADADCVIALGDDRIAVFGHHFQIARLQIEVNCLARAGIEMDTLKTSQGDERRSFDLRELEIELDNLISRELA